MTLYEIVELRSAGVPIRWSQLFGLMLRKTLNRDVTTALVLDHKAGTGIGLHILEAHHLAGGSAKRLVSAGIVLKKAGAEVPVLELASLDMSGHPIVELAEAYVRLRASYTALRFEEVMARVLEGEDIQEAARSGRLVPRGES